MKRRVAIFTHGGIGTGFNAQGLPTLSNIVNDLASDFDLTVFSLSEFNDGFFSTKFKSYCVRSTRVRILKWLYLFFLFLKVNRKEKFEVYYSFWGYPMGSFVVMVGKMLSKKTIVNLLGAETANIPDIKYGHLRNAFVKRLVIWTCKEASELIVVSGSQLMALKEMGVTREPHLIPWGADKNRFRHAIKPRSIPLRFLHVGNLTPVKDQRTLLKAFDIINREVPSMLRIVGPDHLNGEIQRVVKMLGLEESVDFAGFVPFSEIDLHYKWAEIFILSSRSEGQNNSITEAIASGLMPVSTAVGIMDEVFGNQVGVVAPVGDADALATQFLQLYRNPDLWQAKLAAGRRWSAEHDHHWTIKKLSTLISDTI